MEIDCNFHPSNITKEHNFPLKLGICCDQYSININTKLVRG